MFQEVTKYILGGSWGGAGRGRRLFWPGSPLYAAMEPSTGSLGGSSRYVGWASQYVCRDS